VETVPEEAAQEAGEEVRLGVSARKAEEVPVGILPVACLRVRVPLPRLRRDLLPLSLRIRLPRVLIPATGAARRGMTPPCAGRARWIVSRVPYLPAAQPAEAPWPKPPLPTMSFSVIAPTLPALLPAGLRSAIPPTAPAVAPREVPMCAHGRTFRSVSLLLLRRKVCSAILPERSLSLGMCNVSVLLPPRALLLRRA